MRYFKTLLSPIFLLLLIISAPGCKKEDKSPTKFHNSHALVINTGSPAVDGCDWMVVIDSVWYHADNLTAEFKQDSLDVNISYQVTKAKFGCGVGYSPVIHVNDIAKN